MWLGDLTILTLPQLLTGRLNYKPNQKIENWQCFVVFNFTNVIWALVLENLSLVFLSNKGADQPAHPHSLISAFVF